MLLARVRCPDMVLHTPEIWIPDLCTLGFHFCMRMLEQPHLRPSLAWIFLQFDGAEGSWFQKISSRFCSRQSFALEQLKAKQRKEPRFCAFVQVRWWDMRTHCGVLGVRGEGWN